jgi:uncharacterized membrane protein YphA (DoxX/SURF4 family)
VRAWHACWLGALCLLAAAMLVLGVLTPLAALMAAAGMFAQQAPWPLVVLPRRC